MLTDQDQWTAKHFSAYARLLYRKPKDILKKDAPFSNSARDTYFRRLGEEDLFLDPDTGIGHNNKRKKEHVTPSEIANLLEERRSRMLLIYQHASRMKDGTREKLKSLLSKASLGRCHLFAYDAGAVSMVFISRSQKRKREALARLRSWLGPVAGARIIDGCRRPS